jgi:hypothetical protein
MHFQFPSFILSSPNNLNKNKQIKIRNKETVEKTKQAEQRKVAQPPPYATLHLRQDLRMPLFLSLANHNSQSQPLSFSGRHSLSLSRLAFYLTHSRIFVPLHKSLFIKSVSQNHLLSHQPQNFNFSIFQFQLSSALNGAHREDFDGGWGSGMISLKESSIKQGIYSYNNFLGVLISHFLILFRFSNQLFFCGG